MNELTQSISWIAVIVSFVVSFAVGWLWYSPKLFGPKWAAGVGVKMGDAKSMSVVAMITQLLSTFGLAYLFGLTAAKNDLFTIILVVITIILFIISNGKYAQKSNAAVTIESTYILVMAIIMFICQAIF